MASGVAQRYAQAVFELAKESDSIDQWTEIIDRLNVVMADTELRDYLTSPKVPSTNKQATIRLALAGYPDAARRLGTLLVERKRLDAIPLMKQAYLELVQNDRGIRVADVTTATELTKEQQAEVAAQLKELTGKDVQLNTSVDPSLIGGIIVKMGDVVIDGSVSSQLRRLHDRLTSTV